ncbi:peptidylprolyl isomerase [Bacteroidota bacterium]
MKRIFLTIVSILIFVEMMNAQQYDSGGNYDYLVTVSTRLGDIKLILFEDTPMHRDNFLYLVDNKVYDGIIFHRVIQNFMIQGGDVNTRTESLLAELNKYIQDRVPAEIRPNHKHIKGAIAGARQGDHINPHKMSSATQFYIVQNSNGTPHLDGGYTVFGQVISGLDVVDAIAQEETDSRDKPLEDIRMEVSFKKMKKTDISKQFNYSY